MKKCALADCDLPAELVRCSENTTACHSDLCVEHAELTSCGHCGLSLCLAHAVSCRGCARDDPGKVARYCPGYCTSARLRPKCCASHHPPCGPPTCESHDEPSRCVDCEGDACIKHAIRCRQCAIEGAIDPPARCGRQCAITGMNQCVKCAKFGPDRRHCDKHLRRCAECNEEKPKAKNWYKHYCPEHDCDEHVRLEPARFPTIPYGILMRGSLRSPI